MVLVHSKKETKLLYHRGGTLPEHDGQQIESQLLARK
jgi:hypothetical protein